MKQSKAKIFFVANIDYAVNAFLLTHLKLLSKHFDISVIMNCDDLLFLKKKGIDAKVIPLRFKRNVSLISDIFCFIILIFIFIKRRPDAVHSITPKAGFIAMFAARIVNIPIRIHTFTGQVWANKKGAKRRILKFFDYLIPIFSTFNIVDSLSQRNFLIHEKVLRKDNSIVFGSGSVSGVDLKRFKFNRKALVDIRIQLSIPLDAFVFTFLGRLNKDKGILDLAYAFSKIQNKKAFLLIVGPDENNLVDVIKKITKYKSSKIKFVGHASRPEDYLTASDTLCLPSYREGFGNVIIEAAATGIPCIASNIYGISDAIINHKTGVLHTPRDVDGIVKAMQNYLKNPKLVRKYGHAAKKRVKTEFDANLMSKYWFNFYQAKLK